LLVTVVPTGFRQFHTRAAIWTDQLERDKDPMIRISDPLTFLHNHKMPGEPARKCTVHALFATTLRAHALRERRPTWLIGECTPETIESAFVFAYRE